MQGLMRTLLAILAAGSLVDGGVLTENIHYTGVSNSIYLGATGGKVEVILDCKVNTHIAEDTSNLLQHVKFQSSNFENILTWESGTESTPDTVYSVEYKMYGEKNWLAKEGCQRITQKSCNLTLETNSIMDLYYARVTALTRDSRSATKMTDRFCPQQHTTLKPPDVTCIPKVRSIQMIVHPTFTPIRSEEGHQLTLQDIFNDLSYSLELRINHTYQTYLEGKQKEYEFFGLTPNTEFSVIIIISIPTWSKESAPYVCRVKTLPDPTWTYSISGAFLFSMGFLAAGLCYLGYRYITKPPPPPKSLDIQHMLTFQPLRFIQEHVLISAFEVSGPGSLTQPVQYSQIMVSGPKETPGGPTLHSLSEISYLGQHDVSGLQPPTMPSPRTMAPLSYASQTATEVRPPAYTPQKTPEARPLIYAPQAKAEVQPSSCSPPAAAASWPPFYGVFMEGSGKDSLPGTPHNPKHHQSDDHFQKGASSGHCSLSSLSLNGVNSLVMEEPQDTSSFHPHLGIYTTPNELPKGEPGPSGYLKDQLPLLSSLQIEGHPGSFPLQTPSFQCSPTDQGRHPWGLLESLVCSEDKGAVSETKAKSQAPGTSEPEPQAELDTLFKGLALTVQWEP